METDYSETMKKAPPPPPPKNKNHHPIRNPIVGGSYHAAKNLLQSNSADHHRISENEEGLLNLLKISGHPDTVVGEGTEIDGDLQFEKLLRIDGKFKGNLLSSGDLIVGRSGSFVGNVKDIRHLIVEGGKVFGNVTVDQLLLQDHSVIKGDITCRLMAMLGPNVTIVGNVNLTAKSAKFIEQYESTTTHSSQVKCVDYFIFFQ